jgi:glycolate oxidase iron-sulfur subunit
MQTKILPDILATSEGQEADHVLRSCVHCGFCLATCPTYQVLGDELDSPRGRIYLIKEMLESGKAGKETQLHLDRCLTCQSCETTCPSGVEYHKLLTIGRKMVDEQNPRPLHERTQRWLLRQIISRRRLFGALLRGGQIVRPLLPSTLKRSIPVYRKLKPFQASTQTRQIILLQGCAQPSLAPNINHATIRVMDALGIETLILNKEGCCGALSHHMNATEQALAFAKHNIDVWWPHIQSDQVEAIVISESGCGNFVKEYATLLKGDQEYRLKMKRIKMLIKDISEVLSKEDLSRFNSNNKQTLAFQSPCTLQHGQGIKGSVEKLLTSLGHRLTPVADGHLCCGSAGSYSILQRNLSLELRERKLKNLHSGSPTVIASANIGCISHLRAGTDTPVKHWIEILAEELD